MDLNLYLRPPHSSPPRNLGMDSDLSLNSLIPTAPSDSREIGAPEAISMAIEADVTSDVPLPPVFENPIPPYYLANGSCESTCAQWIEESGILHPPSNPQVLQFDQVLAEIERRAEEYQKSSADLLRHDFVGYSSQVPYSNFYDEENTDAYLSLLSHNLNEVYSSMDCSLSQQDLFQPPEPPRNLGLIESHGLNQSSLMPSLLGGTERTNLYPYSSTNPVNRNNASAEVVAEDESEKEAEDKNRCATVFECNICFDIAKEPVVTSCGHLFCWPCLYQWLHVHWDHKECPVCKGEVIEANIIPIYMSGCSNSDDDNKDEGNCDSGRPIPPRPRGNRRESLRQSFYTISQRIGEGIENSWGSFLDYQIQISRDEDSFRHQMLSETFSHRIRSMNRELQREQWITEGEPITVERFPTDGSTLPANDSLDAMDSEIESILGRYTENANFCGSTSSVNSPNPGQFVSIPIVEAGTTTDQAFDSGTVAAISRESSARDL